MSKRILLICTFILVCLFPVQCFAVEEEHELFKFDNYEYYINEDGTVTISSWYGEDETVKIPDQIDNKAVTEIEELAFRYCLDLKSVLIPESVKMIGNRPFLACTSLEKIILSPKNERYAVIDNILFDKIEKALLCYPCGLSETEYTIPDGILTIRDFAFSFCSNISRINIPDSVTKIGNCAFLRCANIKPELFTDIR